MTAIAIALAVIAAGICYLPLPLYLMIGRGWFLTGGLMSFAACIIPIVAMAREADGDAPGLGILAMLVLPIPLILLSVGIVAAIVRLASWAFGNRIDELGL